MKGKLGTLIVLAVVVALIAVTAVIAQRGPVNQGAPLAPGGPGGPGGPGRPEGPGGPAQNMKAGDAGVFVLLGGTLYKYDTSLAAQGSIQLMKPPAPPQPPADGEENPPMPPMPRAGILFIAPASSAGAEKVIAFFGDQFFIVDAATLKVTANGKLPEVQLPEPKTDERGAPGARPMRPMGPPPANIELHARTLYILRANQLAALNIDSGAITGKAELPKPQPPTNN